MSRFICPICKGALSEVGHSLFCGNRHTFDISKKGYVNFLIGSSAGRHGDDRLMVRARTAFLDRGLYAPLRDRLTALLLPRAASGMTLLDAGCGEGYYTAHMKKSFEAAGLHALFCGIDVSKDAVLAAAARDRGIALAVASIYDIPLSDSTVDLLVNLFAPFDALSFSRVMKKGGVLLRAFPAERHLFSMKEILYDVPYENKIDTLTLDGFTLIHEERLAFPLELSDVESIDALFKMTPYYYKTCREGQARLAALTSLSTEASFILAVYRKD